MSSCVVVQRLPRGAANTVFEGLKTQSPATLADAVAYDHEEAVFPAVGGQRIDEAQLKAVRQRVIGVLGPLGFPSESDLDARRTADTKLAAELMRSLPLSPRGAMDNEAWSFLSCVVFPDVVRWRFPESGAARFLGGTRNTLQRLWLRAAVLRDPGADDPFWLVTELPEDALVQIFERPAVWADWHLARSVAREVVNARRGADERFNFQLLVRRVLLEVRQLMPLANLTALPSESQCEVLRSVVGAAMERAVAKEPG